MKAGFYALLFVFMVAVVFVSLGHCQTTDFPDNPQPQPVQPLHKAGFWTVGRWDAPRPLRTNRELLHSKRFLLLELALYGSTFAEVEIARNHRQEPNIPLHGQLYIDAYVPLPVISFMHILANKYICECVGDGVIAAATVWNLMAVKGQYYH